MHSLTWEQVCARRLARHGLATPLTGAPADVVGALGAVHAQVMSAAELGIGLRLEDATRSDVRRALWDERTLVKTFGPRGTVHLVATADLPLWTGALSALPGSPGGVPDDVRMTPEQVDEVVAAIGDVLADAELTVDELTEALVARVGPWAGEEVLPAWYGMWPRWRQTITTAANRGALCFGPQRGRTVTYTSPRRWLPGFSPAAAATAHADLLLRYLWTYGPATPERFANWLDVSETWARKLFAARAADLQQIQAAGRDAWVAAGDVDVPAGPPSGVRLLPYFDAYAYRVGNQPSELLYPGPASERALQDNYPVLVIDGAVAGLWHQRRSGRKLHITVEPLRKLSAPRRRALDEQVERVGHVLEATPELTLGVVTTGPHA